MAEPNSIKIYRSKALSKIRIFWAVGVVFLLAFSAYVLLFSSGSRIVLFMYVPAVLLVMFWLSKWIKDTRLVITSQGVIYETAAFELACRWQHMKSIKVWKVPGFWAQKFISLEKSTMRRKWLGAVSFLRPYRFHIPLGPRSWERYGELEADLKRYAPHLFEADSQ